jgi:hypothetical protein
MVMYEELLSYRHYERFLPKWFIIHRHNIEMVLFVVIFLLNIFIVRVLSLNPESITFGLAFYRSIIVLSLLPQGIYMYMIINTIKHIVKGNCILTWRDKLGLFFGFKQISFVLQILSLY